MQQQPELPWSGRTPASRQASARGSKRERYLEWLAARGTGTDEDAEIELGMRRSSVCSTRNGLLERRRVECAGLGRGRRGQVLATWRVRTEGRGGQG